MGEIKKPCEKEFFTLVKFLFGKSQNIFSYERDTKLHIPA
jgi:hypothetical protein